MTTEMTFLVSLDSCIVVSGKDVRYSLGETFTTLCCLFVAKGN